MRLSAEKIREIIREELERLTEVAPPGREKQVKALKKAKGVDNPYAVAWSQHKKYGEPKNELDEVDEFSDNSLVGKRVKHRTEGMGIVKKHVPDANMILLHLPWTGKGVDVWATDWDIEEIVPDDVRMFGESIDDLHNLVGKWVETPDGVGKVWTYHPEENMVQVDIPRKYGQEWYPVEEIDIDIEQPLDESDEEEPFSTWSDDQASKTWTAMGGDFEKVRRAAEEFADDPDGYAATLHKRVTGKWPREK